MRYVKAAVLLVFWGLLFGVIVSGVAAEKKVIVYGQSMPLTHLDSAYGAYLAYPAGYEAAFVIYEGLVGFDEHMNIYPLLAVSWEVSEDGKTWVFHLRQGVKFHDGTPFNAHAVVVNVERGMDPKRTTTNRMHWDYWDSVEALDEYTVKMVTKYPTGLVLSSLAHGAGLMASPAAIEKYHDDLGTHPVGTGPFMLESFDVGKELVLTRFEDYWGPKPGVEKLIFRYIPDASTRVAALLAGEVDIIDAVPPHQLTRLERDPRITVYKVTSLRPYRIDIFQHPRYAKEALLDKRVRLALNYAIPKEALIKAIFLDYAVIADSPIAPDTFGHVYCGEYPYNPEKARELLAEAGWRDTDGDGIVDKNGQPLQLTFMTPDGAYYGDVMTAEAIARYLREVGVDVKIWKVERAATYGYWTAPPAQIQWDLTLRAFNPSNASGLYHLQNEFLSNPVDDTSPWAWNVEWYSNPQVDELIKKAAATVDLDQQAQLIAEAQRIIWNDCPSIFLFVPQNLVAARKELKGVWVQPVMFVILKHISWEG